MWKLKVITRIDNIKSSKVILAYQVLLNFLNDNNIEPCDCKIIHHDSGSCYNDYYEVFYKEKCTE